MKILLLSDYYPPFLGGGHIQTYKLARGLFKRGHTVSVATLWSGGLAQHETDEEFGFEIHRLQQMRTLLPHADQNHAQRHPTPFADPVTTAELKQLIKNIQPDIVHTYGWITNTCLSAMRDIKNIPIVASLRDYGAGCATRTLIYHDKICSGPGWSKCLECSSHHYGKIVGTVAAISVLSNRQSFAQEIDGVHSISQYVQQVTERDVLSTSNTLNPDQILEVIPDIHDNAELSPYDEDALRELPQEPFILFVGSMISRKGIHVLLDAYTQLKNPPPLVLIGYDGPDAPKTYPANVFILKNLPNNAVLAAWEQCLFGVLPSVWAEPLGDVVIEGMSKAKAVIGTHPGGHEDLITEGKTGLLVPAGESIPLAEAMQTLIDNPELCKQFGQAGYEKSKQYKDDVILPKFEALYQKVIERISQRT